jgi:hypothetical protein
MTGGLRFDDGEGEGDSELLRGEVVDDDRRGPYEPGVWLERRLISSAPTVARLAGGVWWRAAKWGVATSARTGVRLVRAAADPVLSAALVDELAGELRAYARDLLGITELDERLSQLAPEPILDDGNGAGADAGTGAGAGSGAGSGAGAGAGAHHRLPRRVALRVRGARLLRAAAQLDEDDAIHPAYARILTELAPDEGRILRLLATDGAQPMVDVRSSSLIGVGSQLLAEGLSMIGAEAGCAHRERVPAYLENLERLGLVSARGEPLGQPGAYQVLEAQPEVLDALHRASRAKTIQRSVALTAFGHDFCDTCLPTDAAEVEALTGPELEAMADGPD